MNSTDNTLPAYKRSDMLFRDLRSIPTIFIHLRDMKFYDAHPNYILDSYYKLLQFSASIEVAYTRQFQKL